MSKAKKSATLHDYQRVKPAGRSWTDGMLWTDELLWEQALDEASKNGCREILSLMLRSSIPVPAAIRVALADLIEGKSKWPKKTTTPAQRYRFVIELEYEPLKKKLGSATRAREHLAKKYPVATDTIRDIIEKKKTFGEKKKRIPQQ